MGPLQAISLFKNPVNSISAVGHGAPSRQVEPGTETGGNPFAPISKIDGEVTPNLGASGSSYTNGLGHSQHTKNWMF